MAQNEQINPQEAAAGLVEAGVEQEQAAQQQEQEYTAALLQARRASSSAAEPAKSLTASGVVAKEAASGGRAARQGMRGLYRFYAAVGGLLTVVGIPPAIIYLNWYLLRSKSGSKSHPMGVLEVSIVLLADLLVLLILVLGIPLLIIIGCSVTKPWKTTWDVFWGNFPQSCF